jgi:DNA-binding PadR family transcriptional regulator
MRRGDVRAAILVLLDEQPANGYRLMQEIEERSEGAWRPSPGSVYPALSQLEDEALVTSEKTEGGNTFSLTKDGAKYVEEHREKLGEPWANLGGDFKGVQLDYRKQIKSLFEAVKQVAQVGDEATVERANVILAQTRRDLYALLAEDPQDTPDA